MLFACISTLFYAYIINNFEQEILAAFCGAERVSEMNIGMLWKPGPKNACQNSCAFQLATLMIPTIAFCTVYLNLIILTILIRLSDHSD